jgi:lipopolysaccharide/colanic/teichoic acid biosynthesis glycosyltransferase
MLYKKYLKRWFDLLVALILFLLFLPFFLLLTTLLFFVNDGKPFFRQARPGFHEKRFEVIKFKTMNEKRDLNGALLPDNIRLTPIGKFIRKTSLDEIPQLINVLRGDMSLIGPRPLLLEYIPLYSSEQRKRHEVRPGITGWAQVNGRNSISWQEKFQHDVWYVDHLSFWLDVKIIFITIWKVLKSDGISGKNVATAEKFTGSN